MSSIHQNILSGDTWSTVRLARALCAGRHRVDLRVDEEPVINTNEWRMIFGCVPAAFAGEWIGSGAGCVCCAFYYHSLFVFHYQCISFELLFMAFCHDYSL